MEGGGAFAPTIMEFVVVNAHGMFSAHIAHDLDAKSDALSAKRTVQGRQGGGGG